MGDTRRLANIKYKIYKKQNQIQNIKPFLSLNQTQNQKKYITNPKKKDLKPFTKKYENNKKKTFLFV